MENKPRILVVEDEPDYLRVLNDFLGAEGFSVSTAVDGETALSIVRKAPPHLVLLDLRLPGISGFDLCDKIKAGEGTRQVPILVMTAFDDPKKDIACLQHGAEAYLIKPIDPDRLTAYIRSILSRYQAVSLPPDALRSEPRLAALGGALTLDYGNKIVEFEQSRVTDLTPKEFELLWRLVVNRPNTVPRETLYKMVWGEVRPDRKYKTVDVHVHRIREKLAPKLGRRIRYVTGRGYSFLEDAP